jgi:hypothetical protein
VRTELNLLLAEQIAIDTERRRLRVSPYDPQAQARLIERSQVHWTRVQAFGERLRLAIAAESN